MKAKKGRWDENKERVLKKEVLSFVTNVKKSNSYPMGKTKKKMETKKVRKEGKTKNVVLSNKCEEIKWMPVGKGANGDHFSVEQIDV